MRPPAISDIKTHINPFIDMAQEAGVQYFVLLSFLGAEKIPVVPHREIEWHLEGTGIDYTFLRASFYM
ncbi:MAG: hypothetical protein M3490_03120 [Chloroflexota bacterium]|nr:hypothetical protein [Chloroflexota bacterium]